MATPTISHKDSEHVEETNEQSLISDFPVVDHQHFREALSKSGAVKTRISKAIVQGPARAGKTSVKSLILSQLYKSKLSTGVCESPDIAVEVFAVSRYGWQEDEYHWELVDNEAMVEKFASEIRDLMSQLKKENDVESSHNSKGIKELPVDDQTSYTTSTLDDDLKPLSSSKLSHPAKENVAAARVGEMELIHMVNKAQGKHGKLTFHKEWLYFIDCGGQIQFQQLVQAFIPCASVLILVTSLAENLSSQCSASFEYEEDKSYDVSNYLPSIETLLRHLTLMVSSSSLQQELVEVNELSDVIKIPKKLKVLIVATHRDLYEEQLRNGERMETIDEKEEKLEQIFMHIEDNLVFLDGKIVFEVDGRKASQEDFDDPAIKEIRAELRDQAFEVDIPLSWYAFEILLREWSSTPKGCGVLSLKDCETIGFSLGLKKEEVHSALKFFHLLNTILYYPGVSDLVFINPHCLIEVIHELVLFVCKSRRGMKIGRETAECRKVVKQGKISKDVLNTISKKCSQISKFFPDHNFSSLLLRIFKHLLIATERPNKKFFMPALLPLTDPSQSILSSHFSLLLYFKKGVPLGLFCAMIVNLLLLGVDSSVDVCDDFVWSIDRTSTMFSNLITLQHYDMKGKVVFVESNDCFEIHFQYAEDKEKGEKDIYSTLNDTIEKRKYDNSRIKYKLASFCPCPKQPRHAAILHASDKLRCMISHDLIEDPDRQTDTASPKVMTTPSTTRLQTSSIDQPLEDGQSDMAISKDTTSVVSSCEDNEPSSKDSAKKKKEVKTEDKNTMRQRGQQKLSEVNVGDQEKRQQKYLIASLAIILLTVVISTIIAVNMKTDTLHISKRVIGGTEDSIQWTDSSFTMNIFADCFPKGQHVDVFVSVDHYFQFETPKGYKLLSPKYQIKASERLQSPVSITLKHNAVVTNREMAESLALLHISDEGEMNILHGKVERNSTYITFKMSDLCHVAVIGLDKLNQTFLVSFFRKKNDNSNINPLLKILIVIYPFKQNKDIEEKLKSEDWIANDNTIPQDLVGNGTVRLIAEPIGCWKISESAENDTVEVKDQPVTSEMLLEYEISNCDVHKSLIKFRNSHNNKVYQTFVGDKIVTTQWENVVMFITDNSLTIFASIIIVIILTFLQMRQAKKEVIPFIQTITAVLILIILKNIGYVPDITMMISGIIKYFSPG